MTDTVRHHAMEWMSTNEGRTHTGRQDRCQAMVWRMATGAWDALVIREGRAVGHDSFVALKDAQAWCEHQVATRGQEHR